VCANLVLVYGAYLFFQLYSHAVLYTDKGDHVLKSTNYAKREKKDKKESQPHTQPQADLSASTTTARTNTAESGTATSRTNTTLTPSAENAPDLEAAALEEEEEEEEQPQLSLWVTIGLLVVVTVVSSPNQGITRHLIVSPAHRHHR
jgi:Ca2+:H+ antiporter